MAVYATRADLESYLAGDPDAVPPDDDEAVERMLERAELLVDEALGGVYDDAILDGLRKLDPEDLSASQARALSRATCAACAWELDVGLPVSRGGLDFQPEQVVVLARPAPVPPLMLRELAGHGLIRRSGTVPPEAA
jgi:hypothetical protein